jgi:hypothetical protein
MFKLEVVDFAKEKGNREAARKFNVGDRRTGMEERRRGHEVFTSKETCNEAVTVTCVKKWVSKRFRRYFNARNRRSRSQLQKIHSVMYQKRL